LKELRVFSRIFSQFPLRIFRKEKQANLLLEKGLLFIGFGTLNSRKSSNNSKQIF